MAKLKVGILGGGFISALRAAKVGNNPDCEITAVCSSKDETAQKMASEYGGKPYANWKEFLSTADIDAVFISTPNYLHYEMAMEALRLKKHTSVEYPMALTLENFDALVKEAEKNKVVLHHGLNCQLEDYYLTMKNTIPEIGKVFCSKARWFGGKTAWYENAEKRGSMWVAFHMHFLDHFRGLFGDPLWIEAVDQSSIEDKMPMGVIFMEHKDNVTGYIEFGHGFSPKPTWSWSILGTKGHIEFDGKDVTLYTEAGEKVIERVKTDTFDVDTNSFLNQIIHGLDPVIPMDQARKAIEISIAADKSAREGKRILL